LARWGGEQMSQTFIDVLSMLDNKLTYSNTEYIQSFSSKGEMESSPVCFNLKKKKKIRLKLHINELP
jgi:hypothetical protein